MSSSENAEETSNHKHLRNPLILRHFSCLCTVTQTCFHMMQRQIARYSRQLQSLNTVTVLKHPEQAHILKVGHASVLLCCNI